LYNEIVRARSLVTVLLCVACTRTETVTRFVNLHATGSCPVPDKTFGKYMATGDFEPLAANLAQQPLETDVAGQTIDGVPGNVKSLAVLGTPWLGATLVPDTGDVDILLVPASSSCALNGNGVGFANQMVFAAVSSTTLIASGATVNNLLPSFVINLGTGRVARMATGMGKPRTNAAVAALGDGRALVIGGKVTSITEPSIEIFEESKGDFDATTFNLQTPRSDHGAVALVNGDVFVAGGQDVQGLVLPTERLHFDGTSWRSNQGSTPSLAQKRTSPFVLRLADGTIMVGGGLDENGVPVKLVEFFSADGTTPLQTTNVPATGTNAFVALDGGGALFVDALAPWHAWFVAPNVSVQITQDITALLTDVKLFAHDQGGALLWTGSAWLVFDPWSGVFSALANAPTTGPALTSPIAFGEPGMRAWVSLDGSVSVWRDSVRNAFATDADPYLVTDTSRMSPDQLPAPSFTNGALPLDSTHAAFVSDARYLDVAVDVEGGAHVVIRAPSGEVEVGDGKNCAIQPSGTLHVERHGAVVSFSQGGPLVPCAAIDPSARVAVGVRGNGAARNMVVKRLGAAIP
jgi:hypothetical protein